MDKSASTISRSSVSPGNLLPSHTKPLGKGPERSLECVLNANKQKGLILHLPEIHLSHLLCLLLLFQNSDTNTTNNGRGSLSTFWRLFRLSSILSWRELRGIDALDVGNIQTMAPPPSDVIGGY